MKFLISLSLMMVINMMDDFWSLIRKYLSWYLIFKKRVVSIIMGVRMNYTNYKLFTNSDHIYF